jgi:hypothetical protein
MGGFETRPYGNGCIHLLLAVGRDSVEPLTASDSLDERRATSDD